MDEEFKKYLDKFLDDFKKHLNELGISEDYFREKTCDECGSKVTLDPFKQVLLLSLYEDYKIKLEMLAQRLTEQNKNNQDNYEIPDQELVDKALNKDKQNKNKKDNNLVNLDDYK